MDDARGHLDRFEIANRGLGFLDECQDVAAGEAATVEVNLQRADARGEIEDARHGADLEPLVDDVGLEAQVQVEGHGTILDEEVTLAARPHHDPRKLGDDGAADGDRSDRDRVRRRRDERGDHPILPFTEEARFALGYGMKADRIT